MHARLSILAALVAASLIAVAPVDATTAPGASATIPVTVTDSATKITPDKFTLKSAPNVARYPRGATIHFKITNKSSAAVTITLRLLTKLKVYGSKYLKPTESTKPIVPGGSAKLTATFAFRGDYELEVVRNGKIVRKSPIVAF
jgi:hypothetical protein